MMVTASRMPVPEPMAPMKSAMTDKAPMQRPPKAAAVGMYLRRTEKRCCDSMLTPTLMDARE